ncbi:MAG: hypothetical protein QG616_1751, partial [Pseudomonadota bacterium]|nr:hypothetical protein [Pseudomonadota bacterium]
PAAQHIHAAPSIRRWLAPPVAAWRVDVAAGIVQVASQLAPLIRRHALLALLPLPVRLLLPLRLLELVVALRLLRPVLDLHPAAPANASARKGVRRQRCGRKQQQKNQSAATLTNHFGADPTTESAAVRTVSLRPSLESSVAVSITTAPINMLKKSLLMMSPHSGFVIHDSHPGGDL